MLDEIVRTRMAFDGDGEPFNPSFSRYTTGLLWHVLVRRVGDELMNLFRTRYNERFGKGLALRVGKREHKFDYRPASAALGPASVVAASPMDVPWQFAPPCELWNECVDDLRRQSTIAGHGTELMAI